MEIFLCIFCCLFVLLLPSFLCFYLLPSILFKKGDHMNLIMQNLMERLRPLVGSKGWDYCVLWKLSEDQRFIEWMNCCCAGSENSENGCGDEELLFPVSPVLPCRDTMFQHPRTNSCDLLSQLPFSMPLDSGIYAQALISNQPSWLNSSNNATSSHILEENIGTKVLIPLPGGLIELFVTKQISEDQNVIDFINAQCNISSLDHHHHHHQQDSLINPSCNNMDSTTTPTSSFIVDVEIQSRPFLGSVNDMQPPVSPATAFENLNLSYDVSIPVDGAADHRACTRSAGDGGDAFFEDQMDVAAAMHGAESMQMHYAEAAAAAGAGGSKEQLHGSEKDVPSKAEGGGRSNSLSDCSDQIDDEEDGKHRRKSGKGPQCKNLVAERRRRKKLNERLYTLRSLVPKISKLDRASILGDAIEYVKDLQRQAKELQDELEEHSENNDGSSVKTNNGIINGKRHNVPSEMLSREDAKFGTKPEHDKPPNGFHFETSGNGSASKQYQDSDNNANDKAPQMEPQVEVAQIDGNEFFVKVFCEHKPGRFVRLMEAFNSLALEVTNANVTTFRNLVSNVLKVEKKDSKMLVQADQLRDFLLELTRNPSRGLSDISKVSENGNFNNNIDYQHHHHHHHHPNY